MENSITARAKVIYLILLSTGLFFIQQVSVLLAVTGLQLGLYALARLPLGNLLQAFKRVLLLAIVIVISFVLIPSTENALATDWQTPWFTLHFYFGELSVAAFMLLRIVALLTASIWVRDSEPAGAFIAALRWLRIPEVIAIAVDAGISLSSRRGAGNGSGRGRGQGAGKKLKVTFAQIKSGKLDFFDDLLNRSYRRASQFLQENYAGLTSTKRHDAAIILTVVTAAMSLKLLQLLPGLPIAPGHKNLVIVPLIVIATLATKSRYGGFSAGLAIGIVSFMLGYGKFGVLEIAHFALPGLASDFLAPLVLAGNQRLMLLRFALLGAAIGLTRFAANFLIIVLAGAPALAWAVFTPMLISQTVFGALSALIGAYVVSKIKNGTLLNTSSSKGEDKKSHTKGAEDV